MGAGVPVVGGEGRGAAIRRPASDSSVGQPFPLFKFGVEIGVYVACALSSWGCWKADGVMWVTWLHAP